MMHETCAHLIQFSPASATLSDRMTTAACLNPAALLGQAHSFVSVQLILFTQLPGQSLSSRTYLGRPSKVCAVRVIANSALIEKLDWKTPSVCRTLICAKSSPFTKVGQR